MTPPIARWENYVLEEGDRLATFWEHHFKAQKRNVLFVLARGFDPRMCVGLERLFEFHTTGKTDICVIEFDEGQSSPSTRHLDLVQANLKKLETQKRADRSFFTKRVKMWSEDRRRVGSYNAASIFSRTDEVAKYDDILVDVSAMPRSIFFPLVSKLLFLIDGKINKPNLHILVYEDSRLDAAIKEIGLDDSADFLHPFRGGVDMESTAGHPKVWLPLLGEAKQAQLTKIYDLVIPDEISPVLPSPATNPRRADNLIQEYRDLLFDRLRIEPRNLIYVSEHNPFEVYRQLRQAILHFRQALLPLGGCKTILSALSSKLMSLGALLVAYELKQASIDISIAHVESYGYNIESDCAVEGRLSGMLLSGEYYDS
jgi:hypothetical protein